MLDWTDFTYRCASFGVHNPFTKLQWHVTIKHLDFSTAYQIACDVNCGFTYPMAVIANTKAE